MFQQVVLLGRFPATELLQQVVLLDGQPLLEAVHNPTVSPHTHAGLDICMLLVVAQLTCKSCMCYRSAVCIPLGAMHNMASFNTHEGLAEHAAKETSITASAT